MMCTTYIGTLNFGIHGVYLSIKLNRLKFQPHMKLLFIWN
jgi:hypothetical protein